MLLRIPRDVLEGIYQHAREGAPDEVCGLLAGHRDGGSHVVRRAFRVRNAAEHPAREFLLDPAEQLRVTLHVEDELTLEVVGFYHSHPAGPARFSPTDAARASWPGASYLLVHLRPEEGHLSARWSEARRAFEDEPVVVT